MEYISKLTEFRAYEPPYVDKIYIKDGNKTVCIIHADKNWNMYADIIDPFDLPISPIKPIYGQLNQKQCEQILMLQMAPLCRAEQLKKKYGFDKVDYAYILYKTRLINSTHTYWAAWSEYDRAEDYHPAYNKKLEEEYIKSLPVLEVEDGEIVFEDNPEYEKNCFGGGDMFEVVGDLPDLNFE